MAVTLPWIGHPLEMEVPLQRILDRDWNLPAASAAYRIQLMKERPIRRIHEGFQTATAESPAKGASYLRDAVEQNSELLNVFGFILLRSQLQSKNNGGEDSARLATRLVDDVFRSDAVQLHKVARLIADLDDDAQPELLEVGLKAAEVANSLSNAQDVEIAATYAKCLFRCNRIAEAITIQTKAIELSAGLNEGRVDPVLLESLQRYKASSSKLDDSSHR